MIVKTLICDPKLLELMGKYNVTEYIIPEFVSSIKNEHFEHINKTFEKVRLPKTIIDNLTGTFKLFTDITEIETRSEGIPAFDLKKLKKITLNSSVGMIRSVLFEGCDNLTELSIETQANNCIGDFVHLKSIEKLKYHSSLLDKFEKKNIREMELIGTI